MLIMLNSIDYSFRNPNFESTAQCYNAKIKVEG